MCEEVPAFRWDGAALVTKAVVEAAGIADNWPPRCDAAHPCPVGHSSYIVVG
jgi:hypothetical protein